jgi:hypothetical protein
MPDPQAWAAPDLSAGPGTLADPAAPPVVRHPAAAPQVVGRSELLGGDIPLRPLGVSEAMDAAITGIRRNPRAVLGLAVPVSVVIHVLVALVQYLVIGDKSRSGVTPSAALRTVGGQWLLDLASLIVTAYAVLVLAGLLAPVLGRTLFGLPTTLRQTWQEGRAALPRLVGVATSVMVLALLGLAAPNLPFVLLLIGNGPVGLTVLCGILGITGGLALMIWLYVTYVLAAPAVVLERASFSQAFARARILLRGRWSRTFGALLLTLMITVLLQLPSLVIALALSDQHNSLLALSVLTLRAILIDCVTGPFDAGVIALLYIDLRMRREGLDLDVQTRKVEVGGDFLDLWTPR